MRKALKSQGIRCLGRCLCGLSNVDDEGRKGLSMSSPSRIRAFRPAPDTPKPMSESGRRGQYTKNVAPIPLYSMFPLRWIWGSGLLLPLHIEEPEATRTLGGTSKLVIQRVIRF